MRTPAVDGPTEEPTQWSAILSGALLLACSAWVLVERRRTSEFFLAATVLLLCVYFAFRPRLVLPLNALLPLCAIEALSAMNAWPRFRRWIAPTLAAAWFAISAVGFALDGRSGDAIAQRDAHYVAAASALRPRLADERIASAIGWHWSFYLRRPVWTLALAAKRGGVPALRTTLDRHAIDTVVLADFLPEDRALVPLFTQLWGPPERVGDVSVFRKR